MNVFFQGHPYMKQDGSDLQTITGCTLFFKETEYVKYQNEYWLY